MPAVSVIVTTFNRKEFLKETIDSILAQTYQDFELIVVDNCSNYDFFGFIKSFDSDKIRPFQNQNNGIIAVNRNFGLRQAKGKYIAFCDDDDMWKSDKLEIQIPILLNDNVDLVYSNTTIFYESGESEESNYPPTDTLNKLLSKNHITLSSVLVRNNGDLEFNEDKVLIGIEDYVLWINLSLNGFKFSFVKLPLVRYRVIRASYSRRVRSRIERKIISLKINLILSDPRLTSKNRIILCFSLLKNLIRFTMLKIFNR